MKATKRLVGLGTVAAWLLAAACTANAQVRITEVSAWGSGNAPYGTDWFELTNFGSSAVNLAGWTMDDNSDGTAKAALTGISSIAAGQSVIFTETAVTNFLSTWFATNAPAGLQIGNYTGGGVGLSTSGDAVNIFNSAGVLQARVAFGSSPGNAPYQTFDNAAGLNNTSISQLSAAGVNGAFVAARDAAEIGSPGIVSAVPEPEGYAFALAGLVVVAVVRKRKQA